MKRYYTFTVHETYAGSRDGEITVEIESLETHELPEIGELDGMTEEAKEIAYDKYKSGDVEWEESGTFGNDSDTDYDIDLNNTYLVDDDDEELK